MEKSRTVGRCKECRRATALTRHHIVPRSKGGSDEPENIKLLCRECHNKLHRTAPRERVRSKTDRTARKALIKAHKAALDLKCKPSCEKCSNCAISCMNLVLELLVIFFQWLDEATREAYGRAGA